MSTYLAPLVHQVGAVRVTGITVGPLQENCFLVIDESTLDAVLVDPGYEAERILAVATEQRAQLKAIWLTHAHPDHVGAVGPIVDALGLPVYLHPADLPLYERAATTGRMYGLNFLQPQAASHSLVEGDVVQCGTVSFDVLHVPGHSPGQVAFVGAGVCLSGDLLFAGSIGRTDLPLSDSMAMRKSLLRITELADDYMVFPGHGESTTIGRERLGNPFLRGIARPLGA